MTATNMLWAMASLLGALAIILRIGIPKHWNNRSGTLARISEMAYYPAVFVLLACVVLSMFSLDGIVDVAYITPPVFAVYQIIAIYGAMPRTGDEIRHRTG